MTLFLFVSYFYFKECNLAQSLFQEWDKLDIKGEAMSSNFFYIKYIILINSL